MSNIKFQIANILTWVEKNKLEFLMLLAILILGAFMRLYRINEYMTFLGDEGRDVIIVRRLLVYADPILIGPGTSIGQMYLGPLYYYMMAPALLLANYSPVGPAVQIALLGVATIFFIWYVTRKWFTSTGSGAINVTALTIALLYAISPTAIIFSRSSWNPNIMPFFALLTIWATYKVWKEKNYRWLTILGVAFAFVLNSHYLGLLLAPVILLYWILAFKKARKENNTKLFLLNTLYGIAIFAILMSPLLIFDSRHNFQNFKAMQQFITHRDSSFKGIPEALGNTFSVYLNMFVRLPGGRDLMLGQLLLVITTISLVIYFVKKELRGQVDTGLKIVKLWILFGVVGLAFVQREIYDHYMGFLFPAPYLLLGYSVYQFISGRYSGESVRRLIGASVVIGIALIVFVNLSNSPLKDNPSRQLQRSITVAEKIKEESHGEKFNLAVLAVSNYEDGYKYFLDMWGLQVLHADVWDKSTIADQLFVICEEKCTPTNDPKAEIANFGMSKVSESWEVGGVILYKLSHKI